MADISETQDGISEAFRIGAFSVEPKPLSLPTGGIGYVIPDTATFLQLAPIDPVLTHIKGKPKFDTAASFTAYVNRFKRDNASLIFADLERNNFTAVFDYHVPAIAGENETADYKDHTATHPCPWSLEWKRWREVDGQKIGQQALGYFLEEMANTIAEPDAAFLIECATELKVDREVRFKSGTNLQSGVNQLVYEETDTTSGKQGKMVIPDLISIVCPVFFGGAASMVKARLRYRIDKGELSFRVDIMNRKEAEQSAFHTVADGIGAETCLPVLYGSL